MPDYEINVHATVDDVDESRLKELENKSITIKALLDTTECSRAIQALENTPVKLKAVLDTSTAMHSIAALSNTAGQTIGNIVAVSGGTGALSPGAASVMAMNSLNELKQLSDTKSGKEAYAQALKENAKSSSQAALSMQRSADKIAVENNKTQQLLERNVISQAKNASDVETRVKTAKELSDIEIAKAMDKSIIKLQEHQEKKNIDSDAAIHVAEEKSRIRSNEKANDRVYKEQQKANNRAYQEQQRQAREQAREQKSEATKKQRFIDKNGGNANTAADFYKYDQQTKQIKATGKALTDLTDDAARYIALPIAGATALSTKAFIDYETAFTGVRKTVDGTDAELEQISKGLEDMALRVPISSVKLANLAQVGGQLGVPTENLLNFTEAFAALNTATNLQGESGASTLARFMNVAGESYDNIWNVGSAITDLGNHTATTEEEITTMATRMGSMAKVVGISTADIFGYAAALSSLGVRAEMGGSAMTRIWQDVDMAVSSGKEGLELYAKKSKMTAKEFAEAWKSDPTKAFNQFLETLSKSEDINKDLSELGITNVRDIQTLQKLADGYDLVEESIERSNKAYEENTALQTEANRAYSTTESKLKMAGEAIVQASRDVGAAVTPTVVDMANSLKKTAQGFGNLSEEQQKSIVKGALVTAGTIAGVNAFGKITTSMATAKEGFSLLMKVFNKSPKLAAVVPQLSSIAVGIGVVTTATFGMLQAAEAYEKYKADWSRGGNELAESIRQDVSSARELNSLQYELRGLQSVINNPDTDSSELDAAKTRVEEIKNLLAEKYNLDINVEDGSLDAAIEKLKQIKLLQAKQKVPDLLDYADGKKDDYDKSMKDQNFYKNNIKAIKEQQKATENFKGELLLLDDAYKNGRISLKEYNKGFQDLIDATGNSTLGDIPKDKLLNGTDVDDWSKSLKKKLTDNEQSLAEAESKAAEYKQTMLDLANAGLAEIEFGDTEEGLSHIATAVKSANLSMTDWAATIALAMNGVDGLEEAWSKAANGDGKALNGVVNDYIKSMQAFGASAEETATGAALIQNGFRNIDEAASAGAINVVTEQANQLAHSMGLLPENKTITFNAETNGFETVTTAVEGLTQLEGTAVSIPITVDGDTQTLELTAQQVQELQSMGVTSIEVNADGDISFLNEAGEKVAELSKEETVEVGVKVKPKTGGTNLFEGLGKSVQEFLFPSAEAAEVTVDANFKPGTINTDALIQEVKSQIDSSKDNTEDTEATVNVTVKPGDINVDAIKEKVKSQIDSLKNDAESTEATVNVHVKPGDINTDAVMTEVQSQIDSVTSTAGNTEANANVNVMPGTINTSAVTAAIQSQINSCTANASANVTVNATVNYTTGSVPTTVPAASGTANFNLGTSPTTVPDAIGIANFSLGTSPDTVHDATGVANFILGSYPTSIPPITATVEVVYKAKAKGTQNFEGGMAMVNDQKGISDPRELIVDKGHAFIPEGKDVLLPLSKGAKVYTAAQTKAIMAGLRIPHYAKGKHSDDPKNNSDIDKYANIIDRLSGEYANKGYGSLKYSDMENVLNKLYLDAFSIERAEEIIRGALDAEVKRLDEENWRKTKLYDRGIYDGEVSEWKDPTEATLNKIQLNAKLKEQAEELKEIEIESAKNLSDHNTEFRKSNELIEIRKRKADDLKLANKQIENEIEYLQNQSEYEGIENWIDEFGKATEAYYDFLNSLDSKDEQDRAEEYFDKILKYQENRLENDKEIRDIEAEILEQQTDSIETYYEGMNKNKNHQISLAEHQMERFNVGSKDWSYWQGAALKGYTDVMAQAHAAANSLRALGYAEDSAAIQKQQEIWWGEYQNYMSLLKKGRDAQIEYINNVIDMTKKLIKQETEDKIDAIKEQVNVYEDIVRAQKESLENSRTERDYKKSILELQKELANKQEELDNLNRDNSGDMDVKQGKKKLEEEIAKIQNDIQDKQYDHYVDMQEKAYDEALEEYSERKDKEIEELQDSLDDASVLHAMAIERINNHWEGLYQSLIEWNQKYGTGIDEDITGSLENAKLVLDGFRVGLNETYDTAYALKQLGEHSESDPYYDAQADSKYQESYKLSVEQLKIINEMRKNGMLWHRAPESVMGNIAGAYSKQQLEQMNRELADKLRKTGLEVHFNGDGKWYTTDTSGREIQLFHKGIDAGFVGSKSGYTVNPHQEEFAKLLKGELVTTPEQQKAFLSRTMPKFLSNLCSPNNSVDMSGMLIQGGDVIIQGGTITKETIPEIKSALASASKSLETSIVDRIVGGFSKRGSTASASGMLRRGINSL